jgi:hypothetical protein
MPKIIKPEDKRDVTIQVRLTKNEFSSLKKKSNEIGIKISSFVRVKLGFEKIIEQ